MRKLTVLIAFLCVSFALNAQVIKFVPYKYQADVNVYFVSFKYQADAVVYTTPYKYQAKNKLGVWYILQGGGYFNDSVKVYVTKKKYEADVLVYITDFKYQIEYNNQYIRYFKNGK